MGLTTWRLSKSAQVLSTQWPTPGKVRQGSRVGKTDVIATQEKMCPKIADIEETEVVTPAKKI